jgi:hypothetical protein
MTPNVIAAALPEEIDALNARYGEVEQMCAQVWHIIVDFQKHVEAMARITINLAFDTVHRLVVQGQFYKNYYELHHEGVKKYDSRRVITDARLFGEDSNQIRYAALCSRPTGLHNYGEFCIVLDSNKLRECTSVFEENPFVFFEKYPNILMEKFSFIHGYRATWENRSKLAVAKLGQQMTETTQPNDFPNILTHCADEKMQDDFIEVHICKKITCDDIVEVRAPEEYSQLDENEDEFDFVATQVRVVQKKLEDLGKTWTTYN